jgi:hypothetical protein
MHDAGKIIPGLIIFLALLTSPIWYVMVTGQANAAPAIVLPTDQQQCVESTEYMRSSHMEMLNTWRDETVRDSIRTYTAADGRTYDKSLTGTCLNCHSNKSEFCDTCHDYSGVEPNCWDCHVVPEELQ